MTIINTKVSETPEVNQFPNEREDLSPRIACMKKKLLTAPYEMCMARAHHFTQSYKETEGMDPHLRNAIALKLLLENQKITIYPDEYLAGSKTEKFLAAPLSIDRGDFLRSLEFEMDILHLKQNPFVITDEERVIFWEEVFPYWAGRSVRDHKAINWEKDGLIDTKKRWYTSLKSLFQGIKLMKYTGREAANTLLGAKAINKFSLKGLKALGANQYELARNNPTAAIFCFDVQGHLSLGVDKVVMKGMDAIIKEAQDRLQRLEKEEPDNERGKNFLQSAIMSLEAAIQYSERFSALAEDRAARTDDENEKKRLELIAKHCRHVPRNSPRSFHEALQAAHFTLLVGEIQYGNHEVFAVGRSDQYLYPYYKQDIDAGRLTKKEAIALIQEWYLKLSANAEPIPEAGMQTNGTLGNNQHCVTIGGLTPNGKDGTNELSYLMLDAHEIMKGAINQLSVRFHPNTPANFIRRTAEVFRVANGIAVYNDESIIKGLLADEYSLEDARDYCIVGCIETSGQSDTHGCPGGHEMVLPTLLLFTLSRGKLPPTAPGQRKGLESGKLKRFNTFEKFIAAFKTQLADQVKHMTVAMAGKDRAYQEVLPAPYVSALMDDCIERATDITFGGSRYDFTSLDVRGLATLVDSFLAIKHLVYDTKELTLKKFYKILKKNFKKHEDLRQRIINMRPKYGMGEEEADKLALDVIQWVYDEASKYRNIRGGKIRVCYYSYGNHVIDGLMLGATPDGRLRNVPISNGVSPSNLIQAREGPTGPMKSVAKFPPHQVSSGVSLNMRFHPSMLKSDQGVDKFASLIKTYFQLGGMHLQPNVVSTKVLREAQQQPELYLDLVVKVSGYSAYFCDLGKAIQDDIIDRQEFGI